MPGKKRILVVDDSVDAAEVLAMLLVGMGHEVFSAHDGAGALRLAAEQRPDMILLDLRLPDLSGYEVARRLREDPELATVWLVGLSGFSGSEHRQRCAEVGMNAYFEKPIDAATLDSLLNKGT